MRTTLTLDDDVAILLKRLSEERQVSFRTLVNEALREGLRQLEAPVPSPAFRTEPVSLGRCLVGNLDDIAEVLALAEGDAFR
jgi:hypothetical protein